MTERYWSLALLAYDALTGPYVAAWRFGWALGMALREWLT